MTASQLIRDIGAAFRSVELGNGLTRHEARAFEGTDYCTAEDRALVRDRDPETRWQDIPDSPFEECLERWTCDEEGFRFHLPAYMRWYLRHWQEIPPGCGGMLLLQLTIMGHKPKARLHDEQSFARFTLEQKLVIARSLEQMALETGGNSQEEQLAYLAQQAGESYWFKFSG